MMLHEIVREQLRMLAEWEGKNKTNLLDALRSTERGSKWFRPVSWRGTGQAYCEVNGQTKAVPRPRGGELGMTHDIDDLIGEWEVVSPEAVLAEQHHLAKGSAK